MIHIHFLMFVVSWLEPSRVDRLASQISNVAWKTEGINTRGLKYYTEKPTFLVGFTSTGVSSLTCGFVWDPQVWV